MRHFCTACAATRDVRWSRCSACGRDLVTGYRKRDAALAAILLVGTAAWLMADRETDPLDRAYALAMRCEEVTLTDLAWIDWFDRKGAGGVSGWLLHPPQQEHNDPESCAEARRALRSGSNVGTLLRRLDG